MANRKTNLVNNGIYHIFNRSIEHTPIFRGYREKILFLDAIRYYNQENPSLKFSDYRKSKNLNSSTSTQKVVTIINYCLMPTHFHFTLRQEKDNGIQKFIQRVTNSFAHYYNIKHRRCGHLFEDRFKSVLVENDSQLLHLSRYIHLNPVTDYLTEIPENYTFSSYDIYIGKRSSDLVDSSVIMDNFISVQEYKKFVMDRKDYQRKLDEIKHLCLE